MDVQLGLVILIVVLLWGISAWLSYLFLRHCWLNPVRRGLSGETAEALRREMGLPAGLYAAAGPLTLAGLLLLWPLIGPRGCRRQSPSAAASERVSATRRR